ncbi:MAG: M14 family metallopeptidase [Candidatus Vogelbacteria bacterium]
MRPLFTKRFFGVVLVVVLLAGGLFVFVNWRNWIRSETRLVEPPPAVEVKKPGPETRVIGQSVAGRAITATTYGKGKTQLVFIGGIHGGYEWNSVLLAYQFMDYLKTNPTVIPDNLKVTIIPSANPDGVYKVIGQEGRFALAEVPTTGDQAPGRFNAHTVDLNRNFDCQWQPKSMWRGSSVDGGSAPFSEPEAAAIRDFVLINKPSAVVFWHSQAGAVYASRCEGDILPETLAIMKAYAQASGYPAVKSFDAYDVTGDAEGWLASIGIPALTVELKTHQTIEWEQNLAGAKALFKYYGL